MRWCRRKCHCINKGSKVSLADLNAGASALVTELCHDRRYRSILISLGFQVGVQVEVIKNTVSEHGCLIVKISGNRLIINKKLSSKVIVISQ